jgi:hypothetical protein
MHYDFTGIPDTDVPQAVDPIFQQVLTTSSAWRSPPSKAPADD